MEGVCESEPTAAALDLKPDLVVLDIATPQLNG